MADPKKRGRPVKADPSSPPTTGVPDADVSRDGQGDTIHSRAQSKALEFSVGTNIHTDDVQTVEADTLGEAAFWLRMHTTTNKKKSAYICAAPMSSGVRNKKACLPTRLMILDYDRLDYDHKLIERLRELQIEALYWPTHSSTPEAPRLRVVIELDREINPAEYSALWKRLSDELGHGGDKSARYAGQPMFCPARGADIGRVRGAPYRVGELTFSDDPEPSAAPSGLLLGRINPDLLPARDAELLDKLKREFPKLYRREPARDASTDDYALICQLEKWTDGNAVRMDRIARATQMWRAKWDTRRGDATWLAFSMRGHTKTTPGLLKMEQLEQLEHRKVAPVEWIIEGLIAKACHTLWIGRPKTGKSTILRQAMMAAAGKKELWRSWSAAGFNVVGSSRVLYLELEMADSITKAEFESLNVRGWPNTVFRMTGFPKLDDDGLEQLERLVKEYSLDWVIIDSWIRVEPSVPRTMGIFQGQGYGVQRVTDLAHKLGINITTVMHGGKRDDNDSPEMMVAATSAVLGSADDFVVTIVPRDMPEESTRRELWLRGRNYRNAGMRFSLDRVEGRMEMLGKTSNTARIENDQQITEYLLTRGADGALLSEIAATTGRSRPNTTRSITRLIAAGNVVVGTDQRYRLGTGLL